MAEDELRAFDQHILSTIWTSSEPYDNLLYLCDDLGHRFAGSPQEHQAARFLQAKLQDYGLDPVWLEEFPIASWERGPCQLSLTAPLERSFPVIAMPYCPSAEIEAELIDVGEGELVDFERLGGLIANKIVLTDAETNKPGEQKSHRNDKYGWAVQFGAAAIVYTNRNQGMLKITGSIPGRNPRGSGAEDREAPIPGLGISYEAGEAIRRLAKRGPARLRISTENRTFDSISYNVIGEITGSEHPDEIVMLGGHYDGHDIAEGAGDNAAGVVTVVEAARALAGLKGQLKRTIRFVCYGSEEIGLLGAWHNAPLHGRSDAERQIRLVFNLDGAGRGIGGQESANANGSTELVGYLQQLSSELPYHFEVQSNLNSHSDHFPFAVQGIPNVSMSSRDTTAGLIGRGWGHTEADTVEKISLRGLQSSAILVARLAARVSEDDDFPGRRRTVDEVREQLKSGGMLESVEQAGRFPPE